MSNLHKSLESMEEDYAPRPGDKDYLTYSRINEGRKLKFLERRAAATEPFERGFNRVPSILRRRK